MKECCRKYLMEQFGDEDVSNEIYAEYVASVGAKLGEANAAADAGDWTQLDRVMHTIKGNALASGDVEMADLAIECRKLVPFRDMDGCRAVIARIQDLAKTL